MDYKSKVAKIYEVMASKELSKWLLLTRWEVINNDLDVISGWDILLWPEIEDEEIIWHPLHIWHLLDWIEENNIEQRELDKQTARKWKDTQFTYTSTTNELLHYRKDKTKPLPLDPDSSWYDVIDFIFWLIE